jgi:outer membrane cobalamin receptor
MRVVRLISDPVVLPALFAFEALLFGQADVKAAEPSNDASEGPVVAQRSQDGAATEEIVVTAEKRPERLLDVPMSISVITGGDLTRQGATTLKDIASQVPGLSTVEFGPGMATCTAFSW